MSKLISDKKTIDYFLNITEKDIDFDFLLNNFCYINDVRKYDPQSRIIIPIGKYGLKRKNKKPCETTLGIWVINKFLFESLNDVIGYVNEEINQSKYEELNERLSYALLEDKITQEQFIRYEDKYQFLLQFVIFFSSHYSESFFRTSQLLRKYKQKILKDNKEALDNGDYKVAAQIEKDLTKKAIELLGKEDEGLEQFKSGAKGSINNHFKNIFLMKGAMKEPDISKGFSIGTSSYMDGISKEEYVKFANGLLGGVYAKSNNTAVGGYWVKLFIRALQHIKLSDMDDCGTKDYITVKLGKKDIGNWMYSYIIEGNKLVELNMDNRDKYLDKIVKIRFSSLCKCKDGICHKCASSLFEKLDIINIGITCVGIPNTIMQKNMKKFHDTTIKVHKIDVEDIW